MGKGINKKIPPVETDIAINIFVLTTLLEHLHFYLSGNKSALRFKIHEWSKPQLAGEMKYF